LRHNSKIVKSMIVINLWYGPMYQLNIE